MGFSVDGPWTIYGCVYADRSRRLSEAGVRRANGWLAPSRSRSRSLGRLGYDHFEFSLFDVELFYAEDGVRIAEAAELGYSDAELTLSDFLAAIPDVPPGPRMPGPPRRAIPMPPPSAD
jgi:hypothetical protein